MLLCLKNESIYLNTIMMYGNYTVTVHIMQNCSLWNVQLCNPTLCNPVEENSNQCNHCFRKPERLFQCSERRLLSVLWPLLT